MGTAPPEVVLGDEKGFFYLFAADGLGSEKGWTQLSARTNMSPDIPENFPPQIFPFLELPQPRLSFLGHPSHPSMSQTCTLT